MVEKLQRQTSLKSQFFKESTCSICSTPFGVLECTYTKKYCCKLCYKAICSSCSALPVDPSASKTFDLICKSCHSPSTPTSPESKKILSLYTTCINLIKDYKIAKEKIQKTKLKTQSYQKLLTSRETQDPNLSILSKKEELLLKSDQLKHTLNTICSQIEEKDTIYFEAETFLMDEKNRLETSKKKTIELYKTLALKQDENIQLAKTLDKLEMPHKRRKRTDSQIVREVNLRKAYEKLMETEKFFSEKNVQLVEEMKMLERGVEEKSHELEKIEDEIKDGEIEEKYLKELNETLQDQQQLIVKLKTELEASKNEVLSSKKCACVVF